MKTPRRLLARIVSIGVLAVAGHAQTFVGNLNGVSVQSTFTTSLDGPNAISGFGWSLPSGSTVSAIVYGQTGGTSNDALIANLGDPYTNYQVEYNTGATLVANSTYTLSISMGFISANNVGTASYQFWLGTLNGTTFTPLQTTSGLIDRTAGPTSGGSMGSSSVFLAPVSFNYSTGASGLSIDPIVVRWAQTASSNTVNSDFFGIDNVTLSVSAIPEPSTYVAIFGAGALGFAVWRRRRAQG
jgi:hypothetical protein